jgi:hypothetical protein
MVSQIRIGEVMEMAGKIKNYYTGGNTARGFYSLFESNLQPLTRVFILKGGPGTGKSSLMKAIGTEWARKGYDIEYLHCASDNGSIDGVIIPALKVGIVDGTAPHVLEPKAPGVIDEYVNLGTAWNSKQLASHKDEVFKYTTKITEAFQSAHATFAEALKIHDEWETIYINTMDFAKADELTQRLIETLFAGERKNKKANVRHRFLGAATPKGPVDFIQNLTEDIPCRYFIKGRPGSGKSTMLKKLAGYAEQNGFDVEVYHCGFDPHSLDMIIVRERGIAVFDSTAPHEYFPNREGDRIIDMYGTVISPETDEKYALEIQGISQRYAVKMKEGTAFLADAKSWHDQLEQIYVKAMDFTKVDKIRDEIRLEIEQIAQS